MPSKEEYEKIFNEIFGTSIRWSRLSKEDLAQLAAVLANPDALIRRLGGIPASHSSAIMIDVAKKLLRRVQHEGPVVKLLKVLLEEEEGGGEKSD